MYIDLFLGVFILIGIIQGFHRGIVRTLFAILAIVVGFLAALKFSPYVVTLFEQTFNLNPVLSLILGLLLTFFVIMWGVRWLGKSLERTLRMVNLNFINKFFGAILFALLMIVVYSAIIWFLGQTEFLTEHEKNASRSYPYLEAIPERTGRYVEDLKPVFKGFWEKLEAVIDNTETGPAGEEQEN